jgi:hypothetical protein
MSFLALLLLLLLSLFAAGGDATPAGTSEAQVCTAEAGGATRCSPATTNDQYQIPASGTVIHAVVNNGPLPPEYQQGYEITIDAAGDATVIVTPEGAAEGLGDQRTAEQITRTVALGTAGLQQLLRDLDNLGFFLLPTRAEVEQDGVIVGDEVTYVEVRLLDGTWDIAGSGMEPDDREQLDAAQYVLATAVGLDPENPTGTAA